MFDEIVHINKFEKLIEETPAVLAYFSTDECSVCRVLKPKVEELILSNFPQIRGVYINLNRAPELAARYHVFTVPTVVIFFDSKEMQRKSRSFGIYELQEVIQRPYHLLFS